MGNSIDDEQLERSILIRAKETNNPTAITREQSIKYENDQGSGIRDIYHYLAVL
jgi:hypothetical protein